jgi:enoyl-CoA hydratase/carnithine racemase
MSYEMPLADGVARGRAVIAREAFEMGLVSRLVPRADLERETAALATRLARFGPTAVVLAPRLRLASSSSRFLRTHGKLSLWVVTPPG